MKLAITIKPETIRSTTKNSLLSKINNYYSDFHHVTSSFGSALFSSKKNVVRVYNIEKHRPKKKLMGRKHSGKNGKIRNTKIIDSGHSIAFVYDFNVEILKALGLKVKQYSRTFKIVDKQGNEHSVSDFSKL